VASTVPFRTRIVEVAAYLGTGYSPRLRYGSGLLIGGGQVLTAAHVVDGADAVVVTDTDKRRLTADVSSRLVGDQDHFDVAILEVPDAPNLPPVPLARVDRDMSSGRQVIDGCWAVGYPEFQELNWGGAPVRVTVQVRGCVLPLSGMGAGAEGLLSLQVTATPRTLPVNSPLAASEWKGMSGAAVFAGDLLLGVITEHAPRRGVSDISFTALDRLFDPAAAPSDAAAWCARLGVKNSGDVPVLPVTSARHEPAYWATLRTYRARTGVLLQRQEDLAAIEAFATGVTGVFGSGTVACGYLWFQGAPWAGKTALLAEAVYLAPERVAAVAFFINARESQVTQEHFFAAVIPQLAFLLDMDPPSIVDVNAFRQLWDAAERYVDRQDQHLLLVVDGLDEGPSIASVLPEALTDSSRVIVSSRPGLSLHQVTRPGHPLRTTAPIRLSASPAAKNQQDLAEQEIKALLAPGTASDLALDILGILTAAGAGLTVEDLAELTGCKRGAVRGFVDGAASRILEKVGHSRGSRYGFAHRTLQDACREHEDVGDLAYWQKINTWADEWAARHWPPSDGHRNGTPWYLISNYPAALAGRDDAPPGSREDYPRLAALVTDVAWVDSALAAVGVDQVRAALAIAERRIADDPAIAEMLRFMQDEDPNLQADQVGDLHPLGVFYFGSRVGDVGRRSRFNAPWVARPGFVAQQVLNHTVLAGNVDVARAAREELTRRSLSWMERQWAVRSENYRGWPAGWQQPERQLAAITSVACAERIDRAVSVSRDGTLSVWELGSEPSRRILGPEGYYLSFPGNKEKLCVALSADGTRAVTGSYAEHLAVWDLTSGECRVLAPSYPRSWGNPRPPIRWVRAVAISADGNRAVSASGHANELILWDLENATELGRVRGVEVSHLAMTPDLRHGISNGPAWWDLLSGVCTSLPENPGDYSYNAVTAVALAADRIVAAAGYADGTVQWWNTEHNPVSTRRVAAHAMGVHGLAFIADGTKLLSASGDRTVAAWDVNTGGELGRAAFPAPLRCLSASGTNMVVGDAMGGFYYCRWHDSR
jgi:hypothetical protein